MQENKSISGISWNINDNTFNKDSEIAYISQKNPNNMLEIDDVI